MIHLDSNGMGIADAIMYAADAMLLELNSTRLDVVKVGTLRRVQSRNPQWYQTFCSTYMNKRKRYPKLRTIIKRCHTIRTLQLMRKGLKVDTLYAERLKKVCLDYAVSVLEIEVI